ncbi:hypothetical protein EI94DRAFT_1717633 [Lactarius quietus]|nr:hypothetical protein EI94DRAFT_1717633 [Lactarius quietus]
MSFASASGSNSRAPSRHPSHLQFSLEPQQPWCLNHPETLCPNFENTRFNDSRRSVTLPNSDPRLASHSQVPWDADQDVQPSSSHLPFMIGGSSQSQDFGVPGATPSYLPEGPHNVFATDPTALCQPSYPPSGITTNPMMPFAGPSRFCTCTASINLTAPAALQYRSYGTQPFPHRTCLPLPRPRGPRTRSLRPVPLVRVEDEVEWVHQHVLKVTLWLNWSPNADAEAHEPWD